MSCASGGYDLVHIHEPIVPLVGWYGLSCAAIAGIPLVGTFHSFSENTLTNGIGNGLGARRRMNRLHARIAVSEAAAWTAQRFFGGRYRIVPTECTCWAARERAGRGVSEPLRILFIGQAVERKGLPVLLRAFEALREHVPATLTLVGAGPGGRRAAAARRRGATLDDRGVRALGKVSEERKAAELARAGCSARRRWAGRASAWF